MKTSACLEPVIIEEKGKALAPICDYCRAVDEMQAGAAALSSHSGKHIEEIIAVYISNREPSLHELLDDTIVRLVIAADGLQIEDVMVHLEAARRRLALGGQGRQGWTVRS
jgi:hypothetical protein